MFASAPDGFGHVGEYALDTFGCLISTEYAMSRRTVKQLLLIRDDPSGF
jgi:hypothetical protein